MVQTIDNPLFWIEKVFCVGAKGISSGVQELGGAEDGPVQIREVDVSDLKVALSRGWEDSLALRTDEIFIALEQPHLSGPY